MPNNAEIAKTTIDDFREIQRYMTIAKKENATETYAELKKKYIYSFCRSLFWCCEICFCACDCLYEEVDLRGFGKRFDFEGIRPFLDMQPA